MYNLLKISILSAFLLFFYSCSSHQKHLSIVLSSEFENYEANWLKNTDSSIIVTVLVNKSVDSVDYYLKNADGIVITGGQDINPALYGKNNLLSFCGTFNGHRDSLEIKMINYALKNKIPLLGICRGLQMMNVSQGGSLIVDIPTFVGDSIHRKNGHHTWHLVSIVPNTILKSIVKVDTGTVYSNHHQAIDSLSSIFTVAAYAPDSVIEAIEVEDTNKYNFAIGVQWHPEAMDYNLPLSKNIAQKFLLKCKIYNEKH